MAHVSKEVERKPGSRVRLNLTLSGEQTQSAYEEILSKYQASAEIKGFRRGKIPTAVLESKFGRFIREESRAELLNKTLEEIWQQENELAPLAQCVPELDANEELVPAQEYKFSAEYDIMPTIELPVLSDFTVNTPTIEVDEQQIDKELEAIQLRNALAVDTQAPAVAGDYLSVAVFSDCHDHNHDHQHQHQHHLNDLTIQVEEGNELGALFLGKELDSSITVAGEAAAELCRRLNHPQEQHLTAKVEKIQRYDLPEIDDELAQDVSDDYQTLDDLKNSLRQQIEASHQQLVNRYRLQEFYREWLKNSNVDLPLTLTQLAQRRAATAQLQQQEVTSRKEFEQALEQKLAVEDQELEQQSAAYIQQVKVELLRGAVAREQGLTVSEEDVTEQARINVQKTYGMVYEDFLSALNEEQQRSFLGEIEERVLADKIDEHLLSSMGNAAGEKLSYKQLLESVRQGYSDAQPATSE